MESKHERPIKEQIEEIERFHRENEQCRQCFKWLPKNHKWMEHSTGAKLCGEECYKEFDEHIKRLSYRKCGECEHWVTIDGEVGFCVIPARAKKVCSGVPLLNRWNSCDDGCEADDELAEKIWTRTDRDR